MVNFNILPLGQDEAVLGIIWLKKHNPKINWIIGQVKIINIKGREQRQKTKMI
jgi:hypothetical protein